MHDFAFARGVKLAAAADGCWRRKLEISRPPTPAFNHDRREQTRDENDSVGVC